MKCLWFLLALPLLACPVGDDDDSAADDDDSTPIPDFVRGEVRVADGVSGDPIPGVTLAWGTETAETSEFGRADATLPSQEDFEYQLTGTDLVDTWLQGNSGVRDFLFTTAMASVAVHEVTFDAVGVTRDASAGTLVVAIDTEALQPVQGASASIDVGHDTAFVVVGGQPQAGSELVFGAAGIVTFPNVAPGAATVTVTPPDGVFCQSFPGLTTLDDHTTYTVHADAVTVAQFICR